MSFCVFRFLDFIVNEIDLHGNVIHCKKPIEMEQKPIEEKKTEKKKEEEKFELTEENKNALLKILGKDNLEKVEIYLQELERYLSFSYLFYSFFFNVLHSNEVY